MKGGEVRGGDKVRMLQGKKRTRAENNLITKRVNKSLNYDFKLVIS